MAVIKKIVGIVAGISAVAAVGVAVAQGVPPNPFITNPALGAGQQSVHLTPMGETGVPGLFRQVETAQVTTVEQTAAVTTTEAPAPVAVVQEQQTMGAAAETTPAPAPMMVARADRN